MHAAKISLSALTICSVLIVSGAIVLAFFSAPVERIAVTQDDVLIVKADEYRAKFFAYYSSWDNMVSFSVLNGTIKSCEPLNELQYLDRQAGQYTPTWTETSYDTYEYEGTHFSRPLIGVSYGRYFLFGNQDLYDKVIHWHIISHWTEPNTTALTGGAVLVATGLVVGLGLFFIYLLKSRDLLGQGEFRLVDESMSKVDLVQSEHEFNEGLTRSFVKGFLVMTVSIWILNIVALAVHGDIWVATLAFLVWLIPTSLLAYLVSKRKEGGGRAKVAERLKTLLVSLHGVSSACWVFDVGTTYYAIDILGGAVEQNPLGWPLGALGALVFYVPALAFTYLLLYRLRQRISLVVAALVAILASYMGFLNLTAGFQNFGFFYGSVALYEDACYHLLGAVVASDFAYAVVLITLAKLGLPHWLR